MATGHCRRGHHQCAEWLLTPQAAMCRAGDPSHTEALEGHRFGAVGMWPLCGASSSLEVPEESCFPLSVPHLGQGIQERGGESEALPALLAVLVEPCLFRGPPQFHGHLRVGEGQAPQSQDRRPSPFSSSFSGPPGSHLHPWALCLDRPPPL